MQRPEGGGGHLLETIRYVFLATNPCMDQQFIFQFIRLSIK